MKHKIGTFLAVAALALPVAATAADKAKAPAKPAAQAPAKPVLEPKAVELLKAMSAKLAAAKTLSFDAIATYESPSRFGPALAYKTVSEVTLQRPGRLKVIQAGDGPASEFYYDGKTMVSYAPAEGIAAVAEAPGNLDEMFAALYKVAGTYFPFTDYLVSDPYGDLSKDLTLAFYVGQSQIVDGIPTDIVAYESHGVFVQLWIGAKDKLPRRARAVFFDDPQRLRHEVELFDWKVDKSFDDDDFVSKKAASAKRADYAHPNTMKAPAPAPAAKPAASAAPAKAR